MAANSGPRQAWTAAAVGRLVWAIISVFVLESILIGLAAAPALVFFVWHLDWDLRPEVLRLGILAAAAVPAYVIFALLLVLFTGLATRITRWRPPRVAELPIAELSWDLTRWARYGILSHVARSLTGSLLRATPVWVWFMRLNGARIGRRVWVNSLDVVDHCLLDIGDDVVIGAGAHVSGHTVEHGVIRLAPVTIGTGSTIGVSTHVEIGAVIGTHTTVGSLSMVPKFAELADHTTYVGVPVRPLEPAPEDRHDD
ncbi:MAG: hypothetical protein OEW42_03010 [Acidimicrobiia bacterium]|nr:hypothetical protein [Acidimicrobiia bacterium]MDH5238040.1 hypothetical protein [Acidimicrobiia bacterium]